LRIWGFFSEKFLQKNVRFIGADIDPMALTIARKKIPNIEFKKINVLSQISRSKFGIGENEKLAIVGNPPYNDVTSRVKNDIKAKPCKIDEEIKTRDLGLSFMLAFAKLKDDFFALSIAKHPDIFAAKYSIPNQERINFAKTKVQTYFNNLFRGMDI